MKKIKILLILVLFVTMITGCGNNDGNIWLVDSSAPTSSTEGKNGDMYLDTSTYNLYQMVDSEWVKIGNISGKDGTNGKDGVDGIDGKNGITPTITISSDGYWIINGVKTSIKAQGVDGTNGIDGTDGIDGKNGTTPTITISSDGYWIINGVKTSIKAQGVDGTNGIDGTTPTIEIATDGYWIINGVKTNIKAQGVDGITPTITISDDGYWVINGVRTEINANAGYRLFCTAAPTVTTGTLAKGQFNPGDEYICKVNDTDSYRFFVLSTEGDNINLIMEQNIYYDVTNDLSTVATSTNTGLVRWNNNVSNTNGPIEAMDYLYKATKSWTNVPNIQMNYSDGDETTGYGTIKTTNGITQITSDSGNVLKVNGSQNGYENLKARLPYASELSAYDATNKTNLWMYNYLAGSSGSSVTGGTNTGGVYGYWTLTSSTTDSSGAIHTHYYGTLSSLFIANGTTLGIRPVITINKHNIS